MSIEESINNVANALNNIAGGLNAIAQAVSGNAPIAVAEKPQPRASTKKTDTAVATSNAGSPPTAAVVVADAPEKKVENSDAEQGLPSDFDFERDISKRTVSLASVMRADVVAKLAEYGAKKAADIKGKDAETLAMFNWLNDHYANPETVAAITAAAAAKK